MRIRKARAADAEAIANVHVDSSRTTYAHILPAEYLAGLSVDERASQWRRFLSDAQGAEFAYVADDPKTCIVGIASGGPSRTVELAFSGELYCIYLLKHAQRAGLGRRLVSAVAARLSKLGHKSMFVWVLAENPSRRFYEALGATYVTEQVIELAGQQLVEVAYGWEDLKTLVS
jgi:ribosomal protein S18 acetylase RimI-like enzyme